MGTLGSKHCHIWEQWADVRGPNRQGWQCQGLWSLLILWAASEEPVLGRTLVC